MRCAYCTLRIIETHGALWLGTGIPRHLLLLTLIQIVFLRRRAGKIFVFFDLIKRLFNI
jgi:hypothetical protein